MFLESLVLEIALSDSNTTTLPLGPDPNLWISSYTSDLAFTNNTEAPTLHTEADFPTTLKLMMADSSPQVPSATCLPFSSNSLEVMIFTATLSPFTPGCKSDTLVLLYSVLTPSIALSSLVIFPHLSTDNLWSPAKISDLQFLKATTFPTYKS